MKNSIRNKYKIISVLKKKERGFMIIYRLFENGSNYYHTEYNSDLENNVIFKIFFFKDGRRNSPYLFGESWKVVEGLKFRKQDKTFGGEKIKLKPNPDMIGIGGNGLYAFSEKAVEVLADYIKTKGELLPIDIEYRKNKTVRYYILNFYNYLEAFNPEKSDIEITLGRVTDIKKPVFFEDIVENETIFKTPYHNLYTYVTDKFVKRVIDNNLTGFVFVTAWSSECEIERSVIKL